MPANNRYRGSRGKTRQSINALCQNICNGSHVKRGSHFGDSYAEREEREATPEDIAEWRSARARKTTPETQTA